MNTMMEYKGFKAQIMETIRLKGDNIHGLPPGSALPVYHADAFEKWPENWCRGQGVFLVPVRPDRGLWFSWTMNDAYNTAILPTVKGCNPITGMQTSGFHLERYETKCPKHGVEFQGDRYCPECKYKWQTQNYVSAPNTLWWDTWAQDGMGRQFFFTEEELRDVATHLMGKENTVPAFGFAFYRPKEPRTPPPLATYRGGMGEIYTYKNPGHFKTNFTYPSFDDSNKSFTMCNSEDKTSGGSLTIGSPGPVAYFSHAADMTEGMDRCCEAPLAVYSAGVPSFLETKSKKIPGGKLRLDSYRTEPVKEVSIGAGAKIDQTLIPDPFSLDSWKDTPDAVMTIYFVFQEKFEELKAGGMKDLSGVKEGMLEGIPVG